MLKSRLRITSCFLWVMLSLLGFYSVPAKADSFTVTGPSDFYFQWSEPKTVSIQADAWKYGIDSMFWLYDDNNNLVALNDDYYGLDSYISYEMQAGVTYRLRAGVCCGNPEAWYGNSYTIETSDTPTVTPEYPTTTLPPTTTTEEPTTTTSTTTSSTTSTTTTTVEPTTTTVETTTTTVYVVPETVAPTTTTTVAPTTTSTTTSSTTTTSTLPEVATTLPEVTTTSVAQTVPSTTTTTVAPQTTTTAIVQEIIPSTTTIAPSQVISNGLDAREALAIVTSVEVLKQLTSTEASEVFKSVEVGELTNDQAEALVEAVQDAPEEVRSAFEDEINIFGGKFNDYVPLGSTIDVGQRKALVAASGVLFMAPAVSVSSSTSTSSDSRNNSGRRK